MRYPQIDPFPTTFITWYMHILKDIYVYMYIYIYIFQWYFVTNKSRCLETWPKLIVHNISFHPPLRPKPRCECLWLGGMAWVSPVPRIPGSGSQVTLRKKPTGIWLFIQRHHEILYILQEEKLVPIYLTMIQDMCWMIRRLFQLWNWDNFAMSHVGAGSIIKTYKGCCEGWKSSSCTNQHH